MIILSHFRNNMATYVENSKLLLEKLPFLIANFHFWVKFRRKFFSFFHKTVIFDSKITISESWNNHFWFKMRIFKANENLRRSSQIKRVSYSKKSFANEIFDFLINTVFILRFLWYSIKNDGFWDKKVFLMSVN